MRLADVGGSGPFAESVITRYRKLRAQQPGPAGITPALLKVGQEWTAPYYVERRDGYRGEQHPHYVVCHTAADTVPEEIWVLRGEHRELDAVRLSAVFCEQWRRGQRPEERRGSDVPPLNAPVLPPFLAISEAQMWVARSREDRPSAEQKLEYVGNHELLCAMTRVVESAVGITTEELPEGTLKVLGFRKVTAEHRARILALASLAADQGHFQHRNGTLTIGTPT